jgi:hypothetical protein
VDELRSFFPEGFDAVLDLPGLFLMPDKGLKLLLLNGQRFRVLLELLLLILANFLK